jgi:hypothetical protein
MPYRAFTGLAGAPDLVGAAEAMFKRSQEECFIELKMKIHHWGFDNNDLSSIEKNKGSIQRPWQQSWIILRFGRTVV